MLIRRSRLHAETSPRYGTYLGHFFTAIALVIYRLLWAAASLASAGVLPEGCKGCGAGFTDNLHLRRSPFLDRVRAGRLH
jgi:hypothetical protein